MSNDGVVILPEGERIIHKSELFDVRVLAKGTNPGLTRTLFYLTVKFMDSDPMLDETALVQVDQHFYDLVEIGERVQLRCYEHPDRHWRPTPPAITG